MTEMLDLEYGMDKLEARIARVEARPFFFPWGKVKPWTGQAPRTYRLIGGNTDIPHCNCNTCETQLGRTRCAVHGSDNSLL